MPRVPGLAVEIGRRRVLAVAAQHRAGASGTGALVDVRVLDEPIPPSVDAADPEAVGRFLGEALARAGIRKGRAIVALPREAVAVKRMTLPSRDERELPDMVRLAMQRELPLAAGAASIDFVVLGRDGAGAAVMAMAAPDQALSAARRAAEAAGLTVACVTLRCFGAAALLRTDPGEAASHEDAAPRQRLVVDITGESLELTVLAGREIRFSRGVDLRVPSTGAPAEGSVADRAERSREVEPTAANAATDRGSGAPTNADPDGSGAVVAGGEALVASSGSDSPNAPLDAGAIAEAAITEARRSWMSYRISRGAEVADAMLLADPAVAEAALPGLSRALGVEATALEAHPSVQLAPRGRGTLGAAWPLAGLLLDAGAATGRRAEQGIDFANPRRAPDIAARRRRMAIAVVGLLGLAVAGGYTLGRSEAERTEARRADLLDKARRAAPEGRRIRRDQDKVDHLRQWERSQQDWLADLRYVTGRLPPAGDVVLDTISGTMESHGVRWSKEGGWSSTGEVRIVLEGEAKTRAIADDLRERLVKDEGFIVTTTGSDVRGGNRLPYPFGYLMRAQRRAGPPNEAPATASAQAPQASRPSGEPAPGEQAPKAASPSAAPPRDGTRTMREPATDSPGGSP